MTRSGSGAQRQAAVGHHGRRVRQSPCPAAAAGLSGLPRQGRVPRFVLVWVQTACWCNTFGAAFSAQTRRAAGEPKFSVDELAAGVGRVDWPVACCRSHPSSPPKRWAWRCCLRAAAGAPGDEGFEARPRIKSWAAGMSVTGAGGLLDRVDALCFAAPVSFIRALVLGL